MGQAVVPPDGVKRDVKALRLDQPAHPAMEMSQTIGGFTDVHRRVCLPKQAEKQIVACAPGLKSRKTKLFRHVMHPLMGIGTYHEHKEMKSIVLWRVRDPSL